MTPQQLFGLIVRCTGLYLVLKGGAFLLSALSDNVGMFSIRIPVLSYFLYGLAYVLPGLLFMTRASLVTRLCYDDQE